MMCLFRTTASSTPLRIGVVGIWTPRAVLGGADSIRGAKSRSGAGFCLEQKSRQAQKCGLGAIYTWRLDIFCRETVRRNCGSVPSSHCQGVGSPSALSDSELNRNLRQAAQQYNRTLYVPSGALWGGQDIQRLSDSGALKGLFIRMSKHPSCFRLTKDVLSDWLEGEGRRVLFSGSVADLCPLALTILSDYHVVEVDVTGPDGFTVQTVRKNPAKLGAVTGSATYKSFWNSLLVCKGHGGRVYLC
ncbi:hypothetical protein WMY93_003057 [Mugilogobius chulae]|uniref:Uncharacterized protein n=1 Tax=Mugilogobius chulae TaxID=88201 RepID=A0AAW0PVI5_9GOBI